MKLSTITFLHSILISILIARAVTDKIQSSNTALILDKNSSASVPVSKDATSDNSTTGDLKGVPPVNLDKTTDSQHETSTKTPNILADTSNGTSQHQFLSYLLTFILLFIAVCTLGGALYVSQLKSLPSDGRRFGGRRWYDCVSYSRLGPQEQETHQTHHMHFAPRQFGLHY